MLGEFPEREVNEAARAMAGGGDSTLYLPDKELLRNESTTLDPDHPWMPKPEALRKHGINGSVIALIELPKSSEELKPKQLAVVDYGDVDPGDKVTTMFVAGHDVGHIAGYVKSRFGIKAFNYTPDSRSPSYVPLDEPSLTFGRIDSDKDNRNYKLGIGPDSPGVDLTSRSHFTVDTQPDGNIKVTDHSTNGTTIWGLYPADQRPSDKPTQT